MVKYDLSHLTQDDHQNVWGPIQDDEALFLYSIIRGSRMSRILEVGGLNGYSSRNFLAALDFPGNNGVLYTCDLNSVPKLADNHILLIKNALWITKEELDNNPLDMVFFDCHDIVQMDIYYRFVKENIIDDNTVIALHDTNLHYSPYNKWGPFVSSKDGYAHQPVERAMTDLLKDIGYDVFAISTDKTKHSDSFPIRHGVSICRKFSKFNDGLVPYTRYQFNDSCFAVVAKYTEDVSWVRELCCNYVIYDKSKDIPNVGRESETYLRFILENYDNLPEYTVFLQGKPFDHLREWSVKFINKCINSISSPDVPVPLNHLETESHNLKARTVQSFQALFDKEVPSKFVFPIGAQYIVPKSCILNRPKSFYELVRKVLVDTNDTREGHHNSLVSPWTIERMWIYIFDKSIPLKENIKYEDLL